MNAFSTFAPGQAARRWRSLPREPSAVILATDTNRAQAVAISCRAQIGHRRRIEPSAQSATESCRSFANWVGQADVVLVDAPCSGTGTWRRNPEGRWRLTPARLDRVVALPVALARYRGRARQAGRPARLCGLFFAVPRGGRPNSGLPQPPFIVDRRGNANRCRALGWGRKASDSRSRRHRWLFRRAAG